MQRAARNKSPASQSFGSLVIAFCGRRGCKDQGIRKQTAQQYASNLRGSAQPGFFNPFSHQRAGTADHVHGKTDGGMGGGVVQPVMVEDFHQFRLVQRTNRLSRFIVVNQDHPQAGRIQQVPLASNSMIAVVFINNKEITFFHA